MADGQDGNGTGTGTGRERYRGREVVMSRTKPAEERRADLLAAGRALFITKGIAATTLEEITTGAGVSKGLFYQYFGCKDDLVAALQEQFSSQFARRMRDAIEAEPDWAAKLDATVQATFECYRDLHELHEVLFHPGGTEHGPGRSGPGQPGGPAEAAGRPVPSPHGTAGSTGSRRIPCRPRSCGSCWTRAWRRAPTGSMTPRRRPCCST